MRFVFHQSPLNSNAAVSPLCICACRDVVGHQKLSRAQDRNEQQEHET